MLSKTDSHSEHKKDTTTAISAKIISDPSIVLRSS
jgi:hypothetical protein